MNLNQIIYDALEKAPFLQKLLYGEKYEAEQKAKKQVDEMQAVIIKARHKALIDRIKAGHNLRVDKRKALKKERKLKPVKHFKVGAIIDKSAFSENEWHELCQKNGNINHQFIFSEYKRNGEVKFHQRIG